MREGGMREGRREGGSDGEREARVWLSSYFVQGSVVLVYLHLLDKFESSCFAYN